jgi:hypothetical protein
MNLNLPRPMKRRMSRIIPRRPLLLGLVYLTGGGLESKEQAATEARPGMKFVLSHFSQVLTFFFALSNRVFGFSVVPGGIEGQAGTSTLLCLFLLATAHIELGTDLRTVRRDDRAPLAIQLRCKTHANVEEKNESASRRTNVSYALLNPILKRSLNLHLFSTATQMPNPPRGEPCNL